MVPEIFGQEQIDRAVEMGLEASSPSEIAAVEADDDSCRQCDPVVDITNQG